MSAKEFLAMPECVMLAYWRAMPRIKAEQMLSAAQAAVYPHLSEYSARHWHARVRSEAYPQVEQPRTVLTFGGVPMGIKEFRRTISRALGPGRVES